jgi:hypothetical protein
VIYTIVIDVLGPIDPDDTRPEREQADEWVDGLVYWINDTCPGQVWAELQEGQPTMVDITRGGSGPGPHPGEYRVTIAIKQNASERKITGLHLCERCLVRLQRAFPTREAAMLLVSATPWSGPCDLCPIVDGQPVTASERDIEGTFVHPDATI